MKTFEKDPTIVLIGIGILLFLTVSLFSIFVEEIVYSSLLHLQAHPRLIVWSRLVTSIIVYASGFIIGLNLIQSSPKTNVTILKYLFGLLVLSTILSILPLIFKETLRTESSITALATTREFYDGERFNVFSLIAILSFLKYILIAIILITKFKNSS